MPGQLVIRSATSARTGDRIDVHCVDGTIAAVGPDLNPVGATVVDAENCIVGPGFVDIHVHGGGGASFFARDASRLAAYSAWAPAHGVTAYLVSTAGRHPSDLARTLEGLAPAIGRASGAESLGFHLEGPFLNPTRHGAFDPGTLRTPATRELRRYLDAAEGKVRMVTLAPELEGASALVTRLAQDGIVAAMGHSDATFQQARQAIETGVHHVTHLFNAMRPMHQREGGIIAAAVLDGSVTCELICDGVHVAPEMLRLACHLLGPDRIVAVTDNLHLAGATTGDARFLGQEVDLSSGLAVREDGTIVGSTLPMDGHFRTLVREVGLSLDEAFRACSSNPARVLGLDARKGEIATGYDADIVLLDDALWPVLTVCRGEIAYRSIPA